ncbi:MAG: hypothetical protein QOF90_1208 [Acetobacteraceae bacterium]|nr:hypothetical protein [Acetobacteraceae bacterium]
MSSIEPTDWGDQVESREEVPGGLDVSRRYGPELLDPAEEIFDQVTRFVLRFVVCPRVLAIALWQDDSRFTGGLQRLEHSLVRVACNLIAVAKLPRVPKRLRGWIAVGVAVVVRFHRSPDSNIQPADSEQRGRPRFVSRRVISGGSNAVRVARVRDRWTRFLTIGVRGRHHGETTKSNCHYWVHFRFAC